MIRGNVFVDFPKWKNKIKNPKKYIVKKIKKLQKISYFKSKNQEFSILLTNNQKMKKLNFKFRKKNKTTDVLSFPIKIKNKNSLYVGDIAISYEIIRNRSKETNFFIEFDKMWIHGYLHLIGYDHKRLNDFNKMLRQEKLILKYFHKVN